MPEEECNRCGIILDGTQHNCEFREPSHLADEITDIIKTVGVINEYLNDVIAELEK